MSLQTTRSLFFRDAEQVLTLAGPAVPRRGKSLAGLGLIRHGGTLTDNGKILRVGASRALEAEARRLKAREIECRGRIVMPGFVDSHTHLVFAGSRVADMEMRIQGKTYEEIARAGGGIGSSAQKLAQATEMELVKQAEGFLRQFAAHGTTTIEVKSGYGLDPAHELKILKVIHRLQEASRLEIIPTLMAAHALPPEFAQRRENYIRLVSERLIPQASRRRLAEFVDCFCDREAFSVAECRRLLRAGVKHGLVPRIHAEQLTRTGASRLAVELGAASADHLDRVTLRDIRRLAESNVVATLVPGANFHLGLRSYPPTRSLIEAGAIVALATDFNPGTSPTLNMQFVLSLACFQMRMTPAEALSAATINAAYALRRAARLGSLEPGKDADLIVMDVSDYREIPYFFAWNHCVMTVKRGQIICTRK